MKCNAVSIVVLLSFSFLCITGCDLDTMPTSPDRNPVNNETMLSIVPTGDSLSIPSDAQASDEFIAAYIASASESDQRNLNAFSSRSLSGNTESTSLSKTAAAYSDFIVMVWDGALNDGAILEAFNNAVSAARGWSSYKGNYVESGNSPQDVKGMIDSKVTEYGKPRSQLNLLIIGKSFGGAKTYKMSHTYYDSFNDFNRVAMVLVDPHEPIIPGDQGRSNYWYDYVHFRRHNGWNGNYDLTFTGNHANYNGILRIFSTYQRSHWPRGYMFSTNATRLTIQYCDHFEIAHSAITVDVITDAIESLVQ